LRLIVKYASKNPPTRKARLRLYHK